MRQTRAHNAGFTLLEMMIVMFLLVGILGLVIPRTSIGDNLGSTTRKVIGALRALQTMATATRTTIKVSFDLDRGSYRATALAGREEKPLTDAAWSEPRTLPESIRFADITSGSVTQQSGRIEFLLYPNGSTDTLTIHLMDAGNTTMGIMLEPLTGAIKTSDARIEPTRQPPIPDRVKTLLIPSSTATVTGRPRT